MALIRVILAALLALGMTPMVPSAYAINFFRGASGGSVAPPWATNQILEMPYVCLSQVWVNPSASAYMGSGGGSLSPAQGGTGTGSQAHPYLTLSAMYAGRGNTVLGPGSCINIENSTPLVDDPFEPDLLSSGSTHGNANSPTGYIVMRSTDGDGSPVPAGGPGVTPDTVNASAAHLVMSQCGACSGISGDPTFLLFYPPADYWIIDGLNIEGVGGFTTGSFFGCVTIGNSPAGFNAVHAPSHMMVRNSYVHGCGGSGIQTIYADWLSIQNNVVTNSSGAPGYQESGIGVVSSMAGCVTFALNCVSAQTGVDSTIGTVIDRRLITYHQVISGNWVDGHYEFLQPGQHSDGNCIILDTQTISQGAAPTDTNAGAYQYRQLVANNATIHCGGKGIHVFFAEHVDILNNTSYSTNFDPLISSAAKQEVDCFLVNDCNYINNIAYQIGGNTPVRVSYTGGSVGPVSVDNVIPFLHNFAGGTPSGGTPMGVTMQDATSNSIVAVAPDAVNVSAVPGGLSGTMTFTGTVSLVNGAAGAPIQPQGYNTSPNNSSFAYTFSALDSGGTNTVSVCFNWAQQFPLPCSGGNLQSFLATSTGDSWINNDWFGTNGAQPVSISTPNAIAIPPDLTTSPGNNLQASDPQFTNPAYAISANFILAALPTKVSGGAGYASGCVVTLAGGSPAAAGAIKVDTVAGGAISTWHMFASGSYPSSATTIFTQASSTCGGSGASFSGATFGQPLWISGARPDLQISGGSPAKDAGSPDWCLTQDITGAPRACPGSMGAYE